MRYSYVLRLIVDLSQLIKFSSPQFGHGTENSRDKLVVLNTGISCEHVGQLTLVSGFAMIFRVATSACYPLGLINSSLFFFAFQRERRRRSPPQGTLDARPARDRYRFEIGG